MKKAIRAATLVLLLAGSTALAASWEPYVFNQPEMYEFEIHTVGEPDSGYTIDIRNTDLTDESGEALYEVLYTTRTVHNADDVGSSMMGLGGLGAMANMFSSMYMMFLIPALSDMDLEVGERMSMMGMGRITVTGHEEYAGRTGYALLLETKNSDDEYEPAGEWVIDLDLPLPLVTRAYENGEMLTETVLVLYKLN